MDVDAVSPRQAAEIFTEGQFDPMNAFVGLEVCVREGAVVRRYEVHVVPVPRFEAEEIRSKSAPKMNEPPLAGTNEGSE